MNVFEQKNTEPVAEFDRYVREHPDFAERIPDNALVSPSALASKKWSSAREVSRAGRVQIRPSALEMGHRILVTARTMLELDRSNTGQPTGKRFLTPFLPSTIVDVFSPSYLNHYTLD